MLAESVLYIGLDTTYDGGNNIEKASASVHALARNLGKVVGSDHETLKSLAPELIAGSSEQLWSFGQGLAEGSTDPRQIWMHLLSQLHIAPTDERNPHLLRGLLNGLNSTNAKLANDLLDEVMGDAILVQWYPVLQTAVGIDGQGLTRLLYSLDLGKTWIGTYRNLVFGGVTHQIPGRDFNSLLSKIAREPEGLDVAVQILCMRLSSDEGGAQSSESEIVEIGCELIGQLEFGSRRSVRENYSLQLIARRCLVGEKGAEVVRKVCSGLRDAVTKSVTHAFHQRELLQALASAQPLATLEGLCGNDQESLKLGLTIMEQPSQLRKSALDSIPQAELIAWCGRLPTIRYPAVAAMLIPFQPGDEGRPQWTDTARKLIDKAPDRVAVLRGFIDQFIPAGWVGSQTSILQRNSGLLDEFADHPDASVKEFIAKQKTRLSQVIQSQGEIESFMQREVDERFEY